jgi:hypothetical protein
MDCGWLALCCRIVGGPVESTIPPIAAFFDLDRTIISRSSTLAFGPSFYRNGLISRADVVRSALAQLAFRLGGASHQRREKIRDQVRQMCRGCWRSSATPGRSTRTRALRRIAQQRGWPVLTFGALEAAPAGTRPASGM